MKIQKTPKGYLSLLDATTLGRAPDDASDTVIPTIDIEKYYQRITKFAWSNTVAATGSDTSQTVPEGERWLVHNFSAYNSSINPSLGHRLNFQMLLLQQAGAAENEIILGTSTLDIDGNTSATAWQGGAYSAKPFIADAGDQLGVFVNRMDGSGSFTIIFALNYTLLNV